MLVQPRVSVVLAEKSTVSVVVLGKVRTPGTHALPRYENDVAHAIAATGGLTEDTADVIEIHRRGRYQNGVNQLPGYPMQGSDGKQIIRIPLRGSLPHGIRAEDVILHAGDVVFVPSRRHEVFYVVGQLSSNNSVRFTVGDRERELGVGFILPRDREIDVVTAVVMARYIDPIDSPTTATVQRTPPQGPPMLILVDLIKARYDSRETVYVQPGDIIYLNPDAPWWWRRTIDRVIPDLLTIPYDRYLTRRI